MGLKAFLADCDKQAPHKAMIMGRERSFYKVSIAAMLQAESFVSAVSRAFIGFFDPNKDQYTKRSVQNEQDPKTGVIVTGSIEEPISPVHAKERIARRAEGMSEAINTVMSKDNFRKLAILVADSLRDDDLTADEILTLDGEPFVLMIKATVLANAPSLAPLLEKLTDKMESVGSPDAKQAEPVEEVMSEQK